MCLCLSDLVVCMFFFFKQKPAYDMRISDWSSDVCSSDLCTTGADHDAAEAWLAGSRVCRTDDDLVPVRESLSQVQACEVGTFLDRSEERRVGKECVSTCRSGWSR